MEKQRLRVRPLATHMNEVERNTHDVNLVVRQLVHAPLNIAPVVFVDPVLDQRAMVIGVVAVTPIFVREVLRKPCPFQPLHHVVKIGVGDADRIRANIERVRHCRTSLFCFASAPHTIFNACVAIQFTLRACPHVNRSSDAMRVSRTRPSVTPHPSPRRCRRGAAPTRGKSSRVPSGLVSHSHVACGEAHAVCRSWSPVTSSAVISSRDKGTPSSRRLPRVACDHSRFISP